MIFKCTTNLTQTAVEQYKTGAENKLENIPSLGMGIIRNLINLFQILAPLNDFVP